MRYTTKINTKRQKRFFSKPFWLTLVAVILIGIVVAAALEATGTVHWFRKPAAEIIVTAGHPSPPPANNVSGQQSTPSKQPTSNTGSAIGGGTDTSGQITSPSTNSSQWITSKSGDITVQQPIANATLHSGDTISGTAKVSTVNFRLIDNATGVISEGTFNVVNGSFSGTITFTPHSNSGRLDIFSTSSDGTELNEVQISVGLSS